MAREGDHVKLLESIERYGHVHEIGKRLVIDHLQCRDYNIFYSLKDEAGRVIEWASDTQFKILKRFNVEELKEIQRRRQEFNNTELEDMVLFENDKPLSLDPDVLKEWKYVGLSNTDYVNMDIYNMTKTMWGSGEN